MQKKKQQRKWSLNDNSTKDESVPVLCLVLIAMPLGLGTGDPGHSPNHLPDFPRCH